MGTEVKIEKQGGSGQEEFQTQLIEQRLLEIQNKRNYFRIKGERRKLDTILNCLPNGISIVNKDHKVQFENAWLQDRFGNNIENICYKVYRNKKTPCPNCPLRELVEHNNVERSELKRTNGRYYELTTARIGKFNGKISAIHTIVDITERKLVEEKIKKLSRELKKSNKRLAHLALRDSHTGLYNYHYLKEIIEAEFSRAKRHVYPFSVIMLDVDNFKSINDAYGHQFGDLVLRQLARQFKREARRYDVIVRFGGDEFTILLPRTDKTSALIFAQRFLKAVKLYKFGDTRNTIAIKLSTGIASYPENNISKGMDLVGFADQCLSKAKKDGRNRICT